MANQMNLGRKRRNKYDIGDLVRIMIPKIDHFSINRPTVSCKVMKLINQYILGSRYGIINIHYSPGEIEPLGTNYFAELDNIPHNEISVREASHLQSAGIVTGAICNCKNDCNNKRCRCKKAGKNCGSRCHGGRPCQNKSEN